MSTNTKSAPEENSEEHSVPSPGQLLQEARVAANLSQEQVADALKLRLQVVKDIEGDSYESGLSTTFIKGYLRAYARLVELDEQSILDSYAQSSDSAETATELQSFSKKIKQKNNDSRLMRVSYLIGIGIFALLVMWWWQEHGKYQFLTPPLSPEQEQALNEQLHQQEIVIQEQQAEPAAPVAAEFASSPSPETTADETNADAPTEEPVPVQLPESPEPQAVVAPAATPSVETPAVERAPASTPVAESTPEIVQPIALPESEPQAAAAAESVVSPVSEPEPASGAAVLGLAFEQECWLEVYDANEKRLIIGGMKPGRELTLEGQAPFRLVLGTVAGVSISYQGESVDLSSYTPGRVVRMQIPE
ncbi:RodZ domain-containing protein [Aliagarivorans marinus]|uniref:RodZ domain-containing protein n=1 Tax=Aliagarivorans marinus TaxID=561965 RepID=UPI00047D1E58|nr:RodZ domain-containing protein [Aliagarivorans marinus]